jgi:hypothetical protein
LLDPAAPILPSASNAAWRVSMSVDFAALPIARTAFFCSASGAFA